MHEFDDLVKAFEDVCLAIERWIEEVVRVWEYICKAITEWYYQLCRMFNETAWRRLLLYYKWRHLPIPKRFLLWLVGRCPEWLLPRWHCTT